MSEQDNVRTVQAAYSAFGKGDIPGLLGLLTDDIEWITPGPSDVMPAAGNRKGHEEVAQFFTALREQEDVELFEPQEYIAQGDKVVALIKYRGRVKATGREAETELVQIFTLREGKVASFREYFDTALALEAFQPTSGQATAATNP